MGILTRAILIFLFLSSLAYAFNGPALLAHLGGGDQQKGAEHLSDLVKKGNSTAMVVLANVINEIGIKEKDVEMIAQSYLLIEKAANLGNSKAMKDLALLYYDGRFGGVDYKNAAKWFEKAATLGNVNSMVYLGMMHKLGNGVPKDLSKSLMWYEIADYAYENSKTTNKSEGDVTPANFSAEMIKKEQISGKQIEDGVDMAKSWIKSNLDLTHRDPSLPRLGQ